MTTYTEIVESAEARARPILGEVCAQIADVQVRNRGTIGGNICANDPTNHLPPLMVALGAEMTIAGSDGERTVDAEDFFLGVYMTAVGPGELLTKITIPPGRRDGFASVTIGRDGTCLVCAAVSLDNGPRVAIGCVDSVPHRATDVEGKLDGDPTGRGRRGPRRDARPAGRRPCARRLPPAPGRGRRRPRDRPGERARRLLMTAIETSRRITVELNGTSYEREVEARRLLIHFIRDDLELTGSHIGCDTGNCGACSVLVDGVLVKSCLLLAVQADGCSVETVEGLAPDGELTAAPAGLPRAPRAPVRLLHAGDADGGDGAAREEPAAERGRDPQGPPGQHLPLHRLLEHHQGGPGRLRSGGRRMSETIVAPEQTRGRGARPSSSAGPARASRARRIAGSSRARASSSTTSSGTTWASRPTSARRTRTR